jgi:hypothetical protein
MILRLPIAITTAFCRSIISNIGPAPIQHTDRHFVFTSIVTSSNMLRPHNQQHSYPPQSQNSHQQQHQHQHHQPAQGFSGINPHYPGLQQINHDPPIYAVSNFLTPQECDFLIEAANDSWTIAPVVGKGAGEISQTRTSSTCYLDRDDLPDLMRKVSALTGKNIEHCELPQVGRYLPTQQYYQVSLNVLIMG